LNDSTKFRGNHPATVDIKGRLKIPAAFLASLRETGARFYVTSLKGDSARIYSMKRWEEIENNLLRAGSYNRPRQKFLDRANYYGQEVEVDAQGRILIPAVLREAAQISGEVNVMGDLDHLTIWNRARFLVQLSSDNITPEDEQFLNDLLI
jgi:MraZ protein